MPANAENLKPAARQIRPDEHPEPMSSCVLGTEARSAVIGAGHRVGVVTVSVHADKAFRFMMAPIHVRRLIRQLLAVARECGEDVSDEVVAAAAIEAKPLRHTYHNPLPTIEWNGPIVPRG